MTSKQLRVALEELEWELAFTAYPSRNLMKAITAIKQARSAPVQERNFCERCGKRLGSGIHTCTPPAAKRQWVGLSQNELDAMFSNTIKGKKLVNWVARAIEAKLKEKNT